MNEWVDGLVDDCGCRWVDQCVVDGTVVKCGWDDGWRQRQSFYTSISYTRIAV